MVFPQARGRGIMNEGTNIHTHKTFFSWLSK